MRNVVAFLALVNIVLAPIPMGVEKIPWVVTVTILTDFDFYTNNNEFVQIIDATHSAIQKFRKEFGIELVIVGLEKWNPGSNKFNADKELIRLESVTRKSNLMIAFTSNPFFINEVVNIDGESLIVEMSIGGLAVILGNYTIVGIEEKSEIFLIHELGHIFGADHSLNPNSVMYRDGPTTSNFDNKSKKAIFANFHRQF